MSASTSALDNLEVVHEPEYVERLRKLRSEASDKEMVICRAWHGETFAWPGHGASDWVSVEMERARKAVAALDGVVMPITLTCPVCGGRHIDMGRFVSLPHHTHSCQHCGLSWRPTKSPTCGVLYLPGFKNEGNDDLVPCEPIVAPEPSLARAAKVVRELEDKLQQSAAVIEGIARANRFLRQMAWPEPHEAAAQSKEEPIDVEAAHAESNRCNLSMVGVTLEAEFADPGGLRDVLPFVARKEGPQGSQGSPPPRGGKPALARLDLDGTAEPLTELRAHTTHTQGSCWPVHRPADTHVDLSTGKETPLGAPPSVGPGETKS